MIHPDNAVTLLSEAIARIGGHTFPTVITDTVREFLDGITDMTSWQFPEDDLDRAVGRLGSISRIIRATLRDTANPTVFNAGYKANVIPSVAEARVDCRILPGRQEAFTAELEALLGPDVEMEWHEQAALVTTFDGATVDAMKAAIRAEDQDAHVLPHMVFGGTDAKRFDQLGIRSFGFSPLRLPADLDFSALFHGIDERVPVDALKFGVRVLDRFLRSC
ncbi:M20/M25/M40 family metallo-hydrolase [Streptomyces sp. ME19-01-6]|nr:M20/M25/M40 family metallo-hydrolase [Streptomyces sp. ME19-01-6]MDX3231779.1 M20/M25/M40 family metallo-hydrolase [Streptomyces sp. ME19-01-6]